MPKTGILARTMDRRCSVCNGVTSLKERYSVLGVPFVYRYRCSDCGAKMDLFSKPGEWAMALFAVGMPIVLALLPARRFKSESDRHWILVFVVVQAIVIAIVIVRDRRSRRRNPPLG